jgi:hypothetical protein
MKKSSGARQRKQILTSLSYRTPPSAHKISEFCAADAREYPKNR